MRKNFTVEELTQVMYAAADACLKSHGEMFPDKVYYAFGIETYAIYGYFHMALNTHEDFDEYAASCREMNISDSAIENEKWNNPQSWKYFDFNGHNNAWNDTWADKEKEIFKFIEDMQDEDNDTALDVFCDVFKQAGVNTLALLKKRNSFKHIHTTKDFKTIVYEHNDVF